MVDYAETFVINDRMYGIQRLKDGRCQNWAGGCGIGEHPNHILAREALYRYIVTENQRYKRQWTTMAERCSKVLEDLGEDDVFNLAQFKQ